VSISFQHTHHLKRGDDVTSEKKAKKLSGREKKLLGVRRVRAFAPSFSLSFSQLREEKRVMVSQSISVFFFCKKTKKRFFEMKGDLWRAKSRPW